MSALEKALAAAIAVSTLFGGLNLLLDAQSGMALLAVLAPFSVWSIVVSAAALMRAHFSRRAREEEQARARAMAQVDSNLFAHGDTEPFSAARTVEQIDRYLLPATSLILTAGLGAWAWTLLRTEILPAHDQKQPLLVAAFLLGEAFVLFLMSRYLIGLSRAPGAAIARAAGISQGIFSILAFSGVLAAVAAHLGWNAPDRLMALAAIGALAAISAEQLLLFVASFYVPAHRRAPPIESRLAAWLTDPASWTRSVASTLDYQFGVQASHDAMRRFLQRAILPLILIQAALLYALSCFVFIEPHEVGIRERWGRRVADEWRMESGFHLKLPWPLESVRRLPARRILRTDVGFRAAPDAWRPERILWAVPHYVDEDLFMTAAHSRGAAGASDAAPVSLLTLDMLIEFRITNLLDYAYRHRDPNALLRDCAYRAVTRSLARRDLLSLLGSERLNFGAEIHRALQADADHYGLGVEILFVGAQGIHPPVPVAEAFQSVIGALEEKEAKILDARAYAASIAPRAAADAESRRLAAEAERVEIRERAGAEADFFARLLEAHAAAPAVLRQDLQLSALTEALSQRSFTLVAHREAKRVLYFDLKKSLLPELYELAPSPLGELNP
jgi:regulator of protease activity HflC (stomatin/prohibitin superfamily)